MSNDIRVLVVEDEPLIAEAHGKYVERVTGFCLAGIALSGQEALRLLKAAPVDLILLDFNLPDLHGLELCRALRAARREVDIIAVTSNRDLTAVRSAVALGVVQYLLKPFTFRSMQDRLERYRDYRLRMADDLLPAAQSEIEARSPRCVARQPARCPRVSATKHWRRSPGRCPAAAHYRPPRSRASATSPG